MPERLYGLKPFIYEGAEVLILGSMPSVASLQQGFYYGHPQNRLWHILGLLSGTDDLARQSIPVKQSIARFLKVAFFDVIRSCERTGSLDSAIRAPEPEDIAALLELHPSVKRIILNGGLAKKLFFKFNDAGAFKAEIYSLPSTSPANAAWSLDKLYPLYRSVILSEQAPPELRYLPEA
ncbi:MAG TPA: DNA-deoxyinosine glycosylase [Candidatus Avisuccinivibrio pullicola]|nr:DNA-deoxyinosine glycosylase [Candidatus Avisuccinivibrio pullicola]